MKRTVCTALLMFAVAVGSSTVNASLIGATVAADLDGDSTFPMVINDTVEFSFIDASDVRAQSADFDDISVTLRYTNLSSSDPVDFGSSLWTFVFTDWPGVPQVITDLIAEVTNPPGAVIEEVQSDLIYIRLPALGVQPSSSVEWRFEILTNRVPEPATLTLLGLGIAGIGYRRRKQIKSA